NAAAMTSTHDLPTIAGGWQGRGIEGGAECGFIKDLAGEKSEREKDRGALWTAFHTAKDGDGCMPNPDHGASVADAAVKFIARPPSRLALLPLEDTLALKDQPNLL